MTLYDIDDFPQDKHRTPHEKRIVHAQALFWTIFIFVPLFTGWFAYDWLPDESFDPERHIAFDSYIVEDRFQAYGERLTMWKSRKTGEVFTQSMFAWHRREEAKRILPLSFLYGTVGAAAFGFFRRVKGRNFFEGFGIGTALNLAWCAYEYHLLFY